MQVSLFKWFIEHPRSVNETYLQHFATATHFGLRLMAASLKCLLHALVPRLCERSASQSVQKLVDEMVNNRVPRELPDKQAEPAVLAKEGSS